MKFLQERFLSLVWFSSQTRSFAILIITVLGLSACGGGSGGSSAPAGPLPPIDSTPPSVNSNVPAAGATAVARDSSVSVTFSEDVLPISVTASSFTLGNGVSGTVSFDPATNVATFTPDNPLGLLATYTVTLTTAIRDLAGNPLASEISFSFTTVDGNWAVDAAIDPGTVDTWDPQVSVDSNGNAIAVWAEDNGSGSGYFDIYARRYTAATSAWGAAVMIGSGAGFNIGGILGGDPQISFDDDDNALAVWARIDGSGGINEIKASRYTVADDSWSAVMSFGGNGGRVQVPQIAFDASGNAVAVWEHQEPGSNIYSVRASRFTSADGVWSTAVYLENETLSARDPQIAAHAGGNAIAVWQQRTDAGNFTYEIMVSRYTVADGAWSAPASIRSNAPTASLWPQIAMDTAGNAVVVWTQYDDTNARDLEIRANRFTAATGMWGTPTSIDADTGDAVNPEIEFDVRGNAIAVWAQDNGTSNYDVLSSRYTAADSLWSAPTIIDSVAGLPELPQIAVDSAGNAIAVWEQDDGAGIYDVQSSRFSANDGTWSTAAPLDIGAGTIFDPQIAINDSGIAFAIWEQDDGTGRFGVLTNRFD